MSSAYSGCWLTTPQQVRYDPDQLSRRDWWGLEAHSDNRRLRRHHYTVHYSTTRVDGFIFTGVTIAPDQTVVGTVSARPEILA